MNSPNKISVIIIAKNEEVNIEDCLKSVQWADEIIVVDAESEDKTIEIAGKYTDKIFIRKWDGYSNQKRFALSLAKNEWILSLDADERVTPELREEIKSPNDNSFDAYRIRRKNYFLGKHITGCGWDNDYQLRLFKKSAADVTDKLVHESFFVKGKVGKLKNRMLHYPYRNLNDAVIKINNYSTLEALQKYKSKHVTPFDFILHPVSAFIQHFIIRKGFKDGKYGLMVSLLHAMTNLQTYMKMWEMKNHKK
ncbi:MAG TPA: glycosyltransferase family 2 protein [Ignavibacteriaceae bacterium]|nr:glycosyltransferase family 2 protein [Ignavibacteriaceae bacterium]